MPKSGVSVLFFCSLRLRCLPRAMAAKPDVDDGPIAAFVVCGTRGDIQPALALALGVCRDLAFSSTHARASSSSDHGSHAAAGAGAGSGAGAGRGEGYRSDAGAGSNQPRTLSGIASSSNKRPWRVRFCTHASYEVGNWLLQRGFYAVRVHVRATS